MKTFAFFNRVATRKKFLVQTRMPNDGEMFYLRSTIWTRDIERADRYDTHKQACAAIERAKRFNKVKIMKAAQIVEVGGG